MKEREPTVLSTPGTKFLPNVGGGQVEEITHDGVAFRSGRQFRTRAPSSQVRWHGAPKDDGDQREVRVVIHQVNDWGERFHLKPRDENSEGREGK